MSFNRPVFSVLEYDVAAASYNDMLVISIPFRAYADAPTYLSKQILMTVTNGSHWPNIVYARFTRRALTSPAYGTYSPGGGVYTSTPAVYQGAGQSAVSIGPETNNLHAYATTNYNSPFEAGQQGVVSQIRIDVAPSYLYRICRQPGDHTLALQSPTYDYSSNGVVNTVAKLQLVVQSAQPLNSGFSSETPESAL